MMVSRPKTVMNHGIPAARSFDSEPLSLRIRRDAMSETDWRKELERSSQLERS
jgi:hypothetical protein